MLWRRPGELQIGAGTSRAVTVRGLTDAETMLLLDLQRPRGHDWVEARLTRDGIPAERWWSLWSVVTGVKPPDPVRPLRAVVALVDGHDLTARTGAELARAGAVLSIGRPGEGALPDLAILTDAHVSDPVRTTALMRHDIPHLPLVCDDDGVTIGPGVLPGATGCCRCLELARTDDDPCWPALATQLHLTPARAGGPEVARFAASVAAWLARGLLAGAAPGGFRVTAHGLLPIAPTPVHPLCGCVTLPSVGDPAPA